jgi:hypothetical protein
MARRNYAVEARDLLWKRLGERAPWLKEMHPRGVIQDVNGECNEFLVCKINNPSNLRELSLFEEYYADRHKLASLPEGIPLPYSTEGYVGQPIMNFGIEISSKEDVFCGFQISDEGQICPEEDTTWRGKFFEKNGWYKRYSPGLIEWVINCFTQDLGIERRFG